MASWDKKRAGSFRAGCFLYLFSPRLSDRPKTSWPDIWGYMTILLICTPSSSSQMTCQWLAFRREWVYRADCSFALPHLPLEQGSAFQHLPVISPIQTEKCLIFNQNKEKLYQTRECRSRLCDIHPNISPVADPSAANTTAPRLPEENERKRRGRSSV